MVYKLDSLNDDDIVRVGLLLYGCIQFLVIGALRFQITRANVATDIHLAFLKPEFVLADYGCLLSGRRNSPKQFLGHPYLATAAATGDTNHDIFPLVGEQG